MRLQTISKKFQVLMALIAVFTVGLPAIASALPATINLTVHYQRPGSDYEGWNLWIWKNLKFLTSPEGTIAYSINGSDVKDSASTIVVVHNATTAAQTITLPKSGSWSVLVESGRAGITVLRKITGGSVTVEARSTLVITQ